MSLAGVAGRQVSTLQPAFGASDGSQFLQASSSIGRAPVSKTGCWGFESLLACHPIISSQSGEYTKMSAVTEEKQYSLDGLKWLLVVLLVGGAAYGNYYFSAEPILYRVLGVVAAVIIAAFIALQTAKGAAFWTLVKGAQTEARKVVWPTRQERNQTTLVVVAVVLLMALLLWGLDALFGWLASLIIG